MPDIVPNLLHVSSEARSLAELFESSLEPMLHGIGGDAIAVVEAAAPNWVVTALRGISRTQVPLDVAADAMERGEAASAGGWFAIPLARGRGQPDGRAAQLALLVRGRVSLGALDAAARALADAVAIVESRLRDRQRIERLQTILTIVQDWQQTNEMSSLLTRMAEAATALLDADRASIFLWDRRNKLVVGRPALGVEGGELRLPDDSGIVGQVVQSGEPRRASVDDARGIDRAVDEQTGYRTKTVLCVPLVSPGGERLGAFEVLNKRHENFTDDDQRALTELSSYAAIALENTQQFAELLERHEKLVAQAAQDTLLVGESPSIQFIRNTVRRIADTDLAVLLLGENGTGKEIVARSIHFGSRRREHPFVAVNCAALTETLLASELFGHEKGAFTDAHEARAGKFELAAGGTLFLDEIGDMSLAGQAKLLRVLEEKTVVRVGGTRAVHTDVRILAATNQKLAELVRDKRFREDLYFRLNVVSLELPPLRERGDDIMRLAEHFLREFSRRAGRRSLKFTAAARKRLESHTWPGNVRELRNLMERIAYLTTGDRVEAEDLAFILHPGATTPSLVADGLPLNEATMEFQRKFIQQSIDRSRGNVSMAARLLGVHRSNLYRKMGQLGMVTEESSGTNDRE